MGSDSYASGARPEAADHDRGVVVVEDDRVTNAIYLPPRRTALVDPVVAPPPVDPPAAGPPPRSPDRRQAMNDFVKQNWTVIVAAIIAVGGYLATLRTVATEVEALKVTVAEQSDAIATIKVEQARQSEATADIKELRATAEQTARNVAALCQATGANCR